VTAPTPSNWRSIIVAWAFSLLAAAIALHVAIALIRSAAPELIGCGIVLAVAYLLIMIERFRRSRW
jgi:hypothetical protein